MDFRNVSRYEKNVKKIHGRFMTPTRQEANAVVTTTLHRALQGLAGFVGGLLLAECFPPHELHGLAWVALAPLGWSLAVRRATIELYFGACVGIALFHALGLDWLRTGYGAASSGTSYRYWLLSIALNMAPSLVIFPLGRWITRSSRLPMAILLPIVWVTFEFSRQGIGLAVNEVPTPWLQLGASQIEFSAVAQCADLGGIWLVTALAACVNGGIVDALLRRSADRPPGLWRGLLPLAVAVGLSVSAFFYGCWRLHQPRSGAAPVVMLMPSAPADAEAARRLGREAPRPDILLWPEGICSVDSSESLRDLESIAAAYEAACLVGCLRKPGNTHERFNSVCALGRDGKLLGVYDKVFAVPWGEFHPAVGALAGFGRTGITRGAGAVVVELPTQGAESFRVAPLVCYDVAFPYLFRESCRAERDAPQFFAIAASERVDGTFTLQRTMLNLTRWRAIECRRPIVRNVDGGYSGWVDSVGRDASAFARPALSGPTRLAPIPLDDRRTLYVRLGDWVPWVALAAFAALAAISLARSLPARGNPGVNST